MSLQVPTSNTTLTTLGMIVFHLGELINGVHHLFLSELRSNGSKTYTIPTGGLFKFVWCPHYLGEIMSFVGIVLLSQHLFILILQLGSAGYLAVRAYNTKKWYSDKFEEVPSRACLIPFIF
ncbi:hypothetical protein MBANPS3_009635 [Mucor bainieri]